MADHTNLIQRLRDESDLCSNEGAPDIAARATAYQRLFEEAQS